MVDILIGSDADSSASYAFGRCLDFEPVYDELVHNDAHAHWQHVSRVGEVRPAVNFWQLSLSKRGVSIVTQMPTAWVVYGMKY